MVSDSLSRSKAVKWESATLQAAQITSATAVRRCVPGAGIFMSFLFAPRRTVPFEMVDNVSSFPVIVTVVITFLESSLLSLKYYEYALVLDV